MIKIKRCACPRVLEGSPPEGTYYNKKQVVMALYKMQHGKCCYCEQIIPREGHLKAVEHFHPKSVYKWLRNDWNNLLLACAQCNGKKSDHFPTALTTDCNKPKVLYCTCSKKGTRLLIDPSDPAVEPEDHIEFIVDPKELDFGNVKERNQSILGRQTIDTVGLWKLFYNRLRRNHLLRLLEKYYQILYALNNGDYEYALEKKTALLQEASSSYKFAACTRDFIRSSKLENIESRLKKSGSWDL